MSYNRSNCLFCKIADGKISSTRIYEDDDFVAFRDIHPVTPTHVLVIPRYHIATLSDCTENNTSLLGRMLILVAHIAKELGVAYTGGETGFRTIINVGPGGGQEVYHLHMHLLAGPCLRWRRIS